MRSLWLSAGQVDELELDVVGIPEHNYRVGHRLVGVDHAGVLDAEFTEPACPCVQAGAISDAEGDVVQASLALAEGQARVVFVVVQADRDAGAGVHEEHGISALLGSVVGKRDLYPVHPEDPLVPLSAGLYIGDSRREVLTSSPA